MTAIQKTVLGVFLIVVVLSINGFSELAADEMATSSQAMPAEEMVVLQHGEGGESDGAVIGRLKTRDQVITITTGPKGPCTRSSQKKAR